MLLKLVEQITKTTIHNRAFGPKREKRYMTVLRAPAWACGPAVNGHAAEAARASPPPGPFSGPLDRQLLPTVDLLWATLDDRPRALREQNPACAPVTLDPFLNLPRASRTPLWAAEVAGSNLAVAGDDHRRRWGPAPPGTRPRPTPPFSTFFSPPPLT
jgi:hypothetical protein